MSQAVGAVLLGMSIILWNGQRGRKAMGGGIGLITGVWWHPLGALVAIGVLGVWVGSDLWPHRHPATRLVRAELIRFWQGVLLYLTAGVTFWQAVDGASRDVPAIRARVHVLAEAVAAERNPATTIAGFIHQADGPEAEVIATMLWHGYHHGVRLTDVRQQVQNFEEQWAFEQELRQQSAPLWLTILPAILLLNLLGIFGEPLFTALVHSWHRI